MAGEKLRRSVEPVRSSSKFLLHGGIYIRGKLFTADKKTLKGGRGNRAVRVSPESELLPCIFGNDTPPRVRHRRPVVVAAVSRFPMVARRASKFLDGASAAAATAGRYNSQRFMKDRSLTRSPKEIYLSRRTRTRAPPRVSSRSSIPISIPAARNSERVNPDALRGTWENILTAVGGGGSY